jgi:hypothetical protein
MADPTGRWWEHNPPRNYPPQPSEWNGFDDPYWNFGQLVLWVATRNRDHVDAASDRSGLYDVSYGLAAAAVQIEEQISEDQRVTTAQEIRQTVMSGKLIVYDAGPAVPVALLPIVWTNLEIVFDSSVPFVRWRGHRSIAAAYSNLRFLKENVLECFPGSADASAMLLKRGRKMKYDWPEIKEVAFGAMNRNGKFKEWDREWKCQADLERLVIAYMAKRQEEPAVSTVREYVSKYLKEWRAVQAKKS